MKKTLLLAAALIMFAGSLPAEAGGYYRHGYGHHGYGYKYGHRHHSHGSGAYVALGILGGALLLGTLLSRPYAYETRPAYQTGYQAPPVVRRNCQPTTGTGYVNGRLATFGGTWCQDAYGNGYVVQGSEYFIGYAQ